MFRNKAPSTIVEMQRSMFYKTYYLAINNERDPREVKAFKESAYNHDAKFNGTRPITKLAADGNHRAVEFLISCGSKASYAVEGYLAAGYFLSEEKAHSVLSYFRDDNIRKMIADAALEGGCSIPLWESRFLKW